MPILDLTRSLDAGSRVPPGLPPFQLERPRTTASHGLNSSVIHLSVHTGTHLDAPLHTRDGGLAIRDIPLDRLIGPAVVWPVSAPAARAIEVADLEAGKPRVEGGDFVLLSTGWAKRAGTPAEYDPHPWLSIEAARWLVKKGVRLLGIDTPTPELPKELRPADFNFEAHHALLDQGLLILENLGDLSPVVGRRVRLFALPIPLSGADAAPVRVIVEY